MLLSACIINLSERMNCGSGHESNVFFYEVEVCMGGNACSGANG